MIYLFIKEYIPQLTFLIAYSSGVLSLASTIINFVEKELPEFYKQEIEGVWLIEAEPITDTRGVFRRHYCQEEYNNNGLQFKIAQTNISENIKANTLRGFHYQHEPYGENKVISCVKGKIFDIIVDLRKSSKTYLKWQSFEISEENRRSLYVPMGCANAYMTLKYNTWILYYHSEYFSPGNEGGIRYNDPLFKFKWPNDPEIISDRDLNFSDFPLD